MNRSKELVYRKAYIQLLNKYESEYNFQTKALHTQGVKRSRIRTLLLQETDSLTLVDTLLTPKGAEQAQEAGRKFAQKYKNIKYIFVSPLRRTVDTAINIVEGYSPKTKPEFILMPWAREVIGTIGEIAIHSYNHLAKYPYIDRTSIANNPRFWFLDYMFENPKTKIKERLIRASKEPNSVKKISEIMQEYISRVESPSAVEMRITKMKEEMRKFILDKESEGKPVKDDEILLVAHGWFLSQMFKTQEILPKDRFGESKIWKNCDYKSYNLDFLPSY